jgi:4-hydroxy-tetrahydrodipicolinate synthase
MPNSFTQLQGTGAALITPFTADNKIDFEALEKLLVHTSPHLDFWVVQGTTGEGASVSLEEKKAIYRFITANNPDKKPIVWGLGGHNTPHIARLMDELADDEIVAYLSVAPYYVKPTQEGLMAHYEYLADRSPIPLLLYNVPPRTGVNLKVKQTLKLAQHENIIGIKEAVAEWEQCTKLIRERPEGFLVLSGDDLYTFPMLCAGADGVIGVLPNAMPKEFAAMVNLTKAGKIEEARKLFLMLSRFHKPLFKEGNPAGIKALLELLGIGDRRTRLPLMQASDALVQEFEALLNQDS